MRKLHPDKALAFAVKPCTVMELCSDLFGKVANTDGVERTITLIREAKVAHARARAHTHTIMQTVAANMLKSFRSESALPFTRRPDATQGGI